MVDVMTPEQRRRCMSRIKGRDTGPELRLRRALWARGLRYRVNYKLPGRPDIAFVKSRVAIFVDGCFWHGCPDHSVRPKTNAVFWAKKLEGNCARDVRVSEELESRKWKVVRFWEHQIMDDLDAVVDTVLEVI